MRRNLGALLLLFVLMATACGGGIKPIGLHDPLVPLDDRRLVADAQDAIAIARARQDEAKQRLNRVVQWKKDMLDERRWGKKAIKKLDKLENYADARIQLAEMELEQADLRLDLSFAKYDVVTAEASVRNDIAVYALEPLREDADAIRAELSDLRKSTDDHRVKTEKLNRKWWTQYGKMMTGGDGPPAVYLILEDEPEDD